MADQATVASENFGACAHQCLVAAEYFETFATVATSGAGLGVGCIGHQIVVVPPPPAADQLAKIGRPEKRRKLEHHKYVRSLEQRVRRHTTTINNLKRELQLMTTAARAACAPEAGQHLLPYSGMLIAMRALRLQLPCAIMNHQGRQSLDGS